MNRRLSITYILLCYLLAQQISIEVLEAQPAGTEGRFFELELEQLQALLSAPGVVQQPDIEALFDALFDIETLSGTMFDSYLEKTFVDYARLLSKENLELLIRRNRLQLQAALRRRLLADLAILLQRHGVYGVQRLGHRLTEAQGHLDLLISGANAQFAVSGLLARQTGGWRFVDLTVDGQSISELYRSFGSDIIARNYSPPVLISRLEYRDYIILEDFSTTPEGQLPLDWGVWRDRDNRQTPPYQVEAEDGFHYLAARDCGQSVIVGKFIHWNPREYPIMTWCWQAAALPTGGDERYDQTNDSAAGVYVIFSQNWLGVPKQLKYVWSTTLPIGVTGRRPKLFRPWFFVLESGDENLGQWSFALADLYEHHKLKLGGLPADRTLGLGLLTDADDTSSYAEAYYADLRVWTREALEQGKIENYCSRLPSRLSAPVTGCR